MTYEIRCPDCGAEFRLDVQKSRPVRDLACPFCVRRLPEADVQKWNAPELDRGTVKRQAGDDQVVRLTQVERDARFPQALGGRFELVVLTGGVPSYETEVSDIELVFMDPPEEVCDAMGLPIRPPAGLRDMVAGAAELAKAAGLTVDEWFANVKQYLGVVEDKSVGEEIRDAFDREDEASQLAASARLQETIDAVGVAIVDGAEVLALAALSGSPGAPTGGLALIEFLETRLELIRHLTRSSASSVAGEENGGPV